jgi:small redox-active disulfide protein 2
MKIEILGTGCPKCNRLFENAKQAVLESNLEAEVLKVQDINEITNFGVMITPALAVNGEVKSTGKLLSPDEIKQLFT